MLESSCPVIALLSAEDPAYVREAAKRGVFAYLVDTTPDELQSAIDVTLQRFTEYHNLQGAFGRRAVIEQAKGILMARHSIDAEKAFLMLRDHSQHNGHKLADVAAAIVDSHLLLVPADPGGGQKAQIASLLYFWQGTRGENQHRVRSALSSAGRSRSAGACPCRRARLD